jgi:beta-mannanase
MKLGRLLPVVLTMTLGACATSDGGGDNGGGGSTGSGGAAATGGGRAGTGGETGLAGAAGTSGAAGTGIVTGSAGTIGSGGTAGIPGGGGSGGLAGTSGSTGGGGISTAGGRGGTAGLAGTNGQAGTTGTAGRGGTTGSAGTSGALGGTAGMGHGGVTGNAGTNGGGGTTGSAGHGGTTGAGGMGAGCSALPVTPNATQQAKNVLCYLYSQYGNHVLSGQEENATGQVSDANVEVDYIFQQTGKYPAIRSFDVNNAGIASRCLSWWQSNGLCVFGYHMGAPSTSDGYTGSMTAVSGGIASVLTVGSSNNTVFNQRLDNVVNQVMQVQAGGGVVILRLFHEAGGTWFWWSKEGGAQYVKLWNYAFNYITNTRGIKGVLWLLPYDGTPQSSFFPGASHVDLAGADTYNAVDDYSPITSLFNSVQGIAGKTMPIALHENGPIPDPDQLQSTKTNWIWFNTWTAPYPENDTSVTELKKVYSSSYVITRDEMPSLK